MQLTQKQESLISQYLRDVSRRLDSSLPERAREQRVRQLQTRIYRELEGLRTPAIRDEDVIAVLRQAASTRPAMPDGNHADAAVAGTRPARQPPPGDRHVKPVWLGVCAYNADRLGLEAWTVRLAMAVLGLATGPIAVVAYLAAYAEFYAGTDKRERAPIDYIHLAIRAGVPFLALIALRWGGGKVGQLIAYGHMELLKEPVPPLGKWEWFQYYDGMLFFLAFITAIPLAALSGLPLANAWGHSLKRLAQAIIALYGTVLCFGLASTLTGIILDRVDAYLH